jgi:hypothetical protein
VNRPLALLSVGLWVGFLASSWAVASASFRTADSLIGPGMHPGIATRLRPVPVEERRQVLRFVAAEMNRWMFRTWSVVELALGGALLALVFRMGNTPRTLVGVALALTLLQAGVLSPAIARVGRSVDFVARPLPSDIARTFGMFHGAYLLVDLMKGITIVGLGWTLARLPPA